MRGFTLLLLVATLVATSTTYAKAKTTDELINDVEDLLNKAPEGAKAAQAAPAPKAKPITPQAKPMAPQAAAVAAGGMRFQQAQAQQAPGKGAVPNSPFGGPQVNPGQAAAAYASLQGSQMLNSVMNRGGVPQQGMPQPGMPQPGMPSPQQQEMQMMAQQHMMAQQQFAAANNAAMPGQAQNAVGGSGRRAWQPPPSKETNLNVPASGVPAPLSLVETSAQAGISTPKGQHAWSPQATVNKLYRIDQQKIAKGLPAHLDETPEVAPQLQQQTDLLETASKTFSRSKAHGKLRHHAKHRMRHHARHRMRHHARQRSRTSVENQAAKEEAQALVNANIFGYGRAKEVGSSFGIRSFGERTNPAPMRASPPKAAIRGSPGQYSKVNEIAKAEAWERSQKAKSMAAKATEQTMAQPPKAVPRFREIFPQQANDITPFYKAHMAGSSKQGISNDVKSLHDSLSELDKIPDVSRDRNVRAKKDSSRFAENMVQKIDLSKVAENSESASTVEKKAKRANRVSKPEYENSNSATKASSDITTFVKQTTGVSVPHHLSTHRRPHSHYHKKPTALMRFNSIKVGAFKPKASHIVWHNWVSKSKARVKQRIQNALKNFK